MLVEKSAKAWTAAVYLRTSKGVAENPGNTIENQRDVIFAYLRGMPEIMLYRVYSDNGYTGLTLERPAFREMMQDVRGGNVDCIVVKDMSRLSRNHLDADKMLLREFPQAGIRFISVIDGYDSLTAQSMDTALLLPIKSLFNQEYSIEISKKICQQKEMQRKQGRFIGANTVYGYKKSCADRYKLVPDETAAAVVKRIFQWRLEGLSNDGIARRLNQMKIPTPAEHKRLMGEAYFTPFGSYDKAQKWSAVTVIRILSNRIYTGTLQQGKTRSNPLYPQMKKRLPEKDWATTRNAHEPLVSEECFETAVRLAQVDTKVRAGKETPYLLSGLIYCADCGQALLRKNSNQCSYYCCMTAWKNKDGCTSHRIRCDRMEQIVKDAIRSRMNEIAMLKNELEGPECAEKFNAYARQLNNAAEVLRNKIFDQKSLIDALKRARNENVVSREDAVEFKRIFRKELDVLETEAENLYRQLDGVRNKTYMDMRWMAPFFTYKDMGEFSREPVVMLVEGVFLHADKSVTVRFIKEREFAGLTKILSCQVSDDMMDALHS